MSTAGEKNEQEVARARAAAEAADKVFVLPEMLEAVLLMQHREQMEQLHGCRRVPRFLRVIDGSLKLKRRLFLAPEVDHGDKWILDDRDHSITHLPPYGPPPPPPNPHIRIVIPFTYNPMFLSEYTGGPYFTNSRNATPSDGSLDIAHSLFSPRCTISKRRSLVVQPPVIRVTVYRGNVSRDVWNARGLTLDNLRTAVQRLAPNSTRGRKLRIDGAVFAPQALIEQVRREGSYQVRFSFGQLLDNSPNHLPPQFAGFGAASVQFSNDIRTLILSFLRPAEIMRLQQVSRPMRIAMKCQESYEAAFIRPSLSTQYWLIDMLDEDHPVCGRISPDITSRPDELEKLWDCLGQWDPTRERLAIRKALVYNETVFALPQPNIGKQAAECEVELLFNVPPTGIYHNSSLRNMLVTNPPVREADIVGKQVELSIKVAGELRTRDVLIADQQIKSVRVTGHVLVALAVWEDVQDNTLEMSRSDLYAMWTDYMMSF